MLGMRYSIAYKPFAQQPYCCVPATLQWILYRRGFKTFDQGELGAELGLRLPIKGRAMFTHPKIKFLNKEPKGGYGTQIEKPQYSIQNFFDRYKIPLKISNLYHIDTVAQLKKIIIANLSSNNDTILRYSNKIFKENGQKSYGHFSVICSFDQNTGLVGIGDPEEPHFKTATLEDIIFSTSDTIDGVQRGIYIVFNYQQGV